MRMLNDNELALVAGGNGSSDAYDNDGLGGNWYGYGTYGGGGGSGGGGYWYWTFTPGTPVHTNNGAIVVTANSGYWSYQSHGYNGGGEGGGGSGISGINGGLTDFAEELQNQCEVDNKVDFAAQQISNAIKAMPDWNEREYAAIVWMTPDGQIHTSALDRGQTVAEALALGQTAPATNITVPNLNGGIILAVVHSHPDIGYDAAGDLENRYPSDRPTDGDYTTFEALVGHDARFSNNAAFAQYILGPDGVLREYNAKDGRINPTNDTDPNSRSNLAKDRPCSG
jgi:hypothetical protein